MLVLFLFFSARCFRLWRHPDVAWASPGQPRSEVVRSYCLGTSPAASLLPGRHTFRGGFLPTTRIASPTLGLASHQPSPPRPPAAHIASPGMNWQSIGIIGGMNAEQGRGRCVSRAMNHTERDGQIRTQLRSRAGPADDVT